MMVTQVWLFCKHSGVWVLWVVLVGLGGWFAPVQAQVREPAVSSPLPTLPFQRSLSTKSYTLSSLGMFTTAQQWDEVRSLSGERFEPFALDSERQGAIADLSQPATIPASVDVSTVADVPKIIRVMRQGRSPRMTRLVPMTSQNYREFNLVQ